MSNALATMAPNGVQTITDTRKRDQLLRSLILPKASPEQLELVLAKRCSGCKRYVPLDQYHKNRGKRHGVQARCRACLARKAKSDGLTPEARILGRVRMAGGEDCWRWSGYHSSTGYGNVTSGGKRMGVHVAIYRILVGPVPEGKELDHLCRRRWCCNPAHLEPVAHQVNVLRGSAPPAGNARKTHCIHGHEFTPENTARQKHGRACRRCVADAQARYRARKRNNEQ